MAAKKKTVKKRNSSTNKKTILPKLLYPLSNKKPVEKIKRIFHAVGVMKTEQESTPYHEGIYSTFTTEQINTHIPQYKVVPYSGCASNKNNMAYTLCNW